MKHARKPNPKHARRQLDSHEVDLEALVQKQDTQLRLLGNRSFEEWAKLGYAVRKGEHAWTHDSNGVPLFAKTQVVERDPDAYNGFDSEDWGWDQHKDD